MFYYIFASTKSQGRHKMYTTLLTTHSLARWVVLVFIVFSIYRAFIGYTKSKPFSKIDNIFRHWTATMAHIQLMIGIMLYTKSPIVKYYWENTGVPSQNSELSFYGIVHITLMITAILLLTIGSAYTKRKTTDKEKFKTMLFWFSIALLIIFIGIPWAFSPLSNRPYLRTF